MKSALTAYLILLLATQAHAQSTYHENVRELKDRDTPFHLAVGEVFEGSPARRAGLRAGDRIVGIDGARIRTPSEYTFMRYYYDTRRDITLTVLRRKALIDVFIGDAAPVRRGGFYWRNAYTGFHDHLAEWDLELAGGRKALIRSSGGKTGKEESKDAVADLFDAFGVREPRIATQAGRLLLFFPARGWESLTRLMASDRAGDKEWGKAILNAYIHLRFGELTEAAKTIADKKLTENAPDPFLGDLAVFYRKICGSPPEWGRKQIWEAYGVDLTFFVICYPYPVKPEKAVTKSFAFDPEFQRLFDQATAGVWVDWEGIKSRAMRYANEGEGDPIETYVGQIKASLIDMKNHGGWPFRSALVQTHDQRTRILAAMTRRLKERPEERVLTAFVMLCPAMLNNDAHQFKRVYPILFRAGIRERASANAMVGGALNIWKQRQKYRDMIAEFEKSDPKPEFYEYMLRTSPGFRNRLRHGSYYRYDYGVMGLEAWANEGMHDVARALTAPLELAELDRLCNLEETRDLELRRKAFGMLTREVAECPSRQRMDQFIGLAKHMPPGDVFDAACFVFGYHYSRSTGGHLKVDSLFPECFNVWERVHYETVAAELKVTKLTGVELVKMARDIFGRAGTPSVCLLLAQKLAAEGERGTAALYRRKVLDFYENLTSGYSSYKYSHLRRRAFRDLVSVPGLRTQAAEHRERALIRAMDSDYVLAAIDDFYAGKFGKADGMIGHLISSLGDSARRAGGTFVFDGRVHCDVAALRRALICRAVMSAKLSGDDVTALAGLKGVDMERVLARLQKAEETVAKGPVQFAVDLLDGSTVVGVPDIKTVLVKTSYADIPLPLAKIQSIAFPEDRRIAEVQLRNGDVLNGVVELGAVKLTKASGTVSVAGKNIRLIAMHKSQIDRFRAFVMREKVKNK